MNIDLYTKTILTVIAACLVWMCMNGVTPSASAQARQTPPTHVLLVDEKDEPLDTPNGLRVNVANPNIPVTINQATPVPVTVHQTVPVAITSIQRQGTWQPIVVDVLKQPPTLMPTP